MIYSEEKKFVFIAVPKTGTTAIQNLLRGIDPDLWINHVRDAGGARVKVQTHASASRIRAIMGPRARDFTFVAFLREPGAVVLSQYNYYRIGRAAYNQGLTGQPRPEGIRFRPGVAARVLFAKALPLPLWARLYPFKTGSQFVTAPGGTIAVDRIGLMERLQPDVTAIFGALGYDPADLQLPVKNRTDYARDSDRIAQLRRVVARRQPQDIALYDRVRAASPQTAWRSEP